MCVKQTNAFRSKVQASPSEYICWNLESFVPQELKIILDVGQFKKF